MRLLALFAALAPCVIAKIPITNDSLFLKLQKPYDQLSLTITPDGSICLPSFINTFHFQVYRESPPGQVCCTDIYKEDGFRSCQVTYYGFCRWKQNIVYSKLESDIQPCFVNEELKNAKAGMKQILHDGLKGFWIGFTYKHDPSKTEHFAQIEEWPTKGHP